MENHHAHWKKSTTGLPEGKYHELHLQIPSKKIVMQKKKGSQLFPGPIAGACYDLPDASASMGDLPDTTNGTKRLAALETAEGGKDGNCEPRI